jgi:hypothetical protein
VAGLRFDSNLTHPDRYGHQIWIATHVSSPTCSPCSALRGPEKRSTFALGRPAFRWLSPPETRFRQNVWESGARNRVPKYG